MAIWKKIRDIGGGGGFCGVLATTKFSFLLHFSEIIFCAGPILAKIYRKFSKFSKKFRLIKIRTFKNTFWSNFGQILPFLPKMAVFGTKTPFFSKFRRLRRRNWVFSVAFGGRSVESIPPFGPPQITLKKIILQRILLRYIQVLIKIP